MKKYALSLLVIFSFLGYSLHEKKEAAEHTVIPPQQSLQTPGQTNTPTQAAPSAGMPSQNATVQPTTPQASGIYKDGVYTGIAANAFYGNIQVSATIQNGKITDVVFLQYPNDRDESISINTQAMPYLKQEAIQAQSARVDVVSGATDSSEAFMQSLQSALDKAKNA